MWTTSDIRNAKSPELTEDKARLADEIIDLLAKQGFSYMEAGDFLFQVHRELEYRFSKASLPRS